MADTVRSATDADTDADTDVDAVASLADVQRLKSRRRVDLAISCFRHSDSSRCPLDQERLRRSRVTSDLRRQHIAAQARPQCESVFFVHRSVHLIEPGLDA